MRPDKAQSFQSVGSRYGSRAVRLTLATAVASMLTVFAVLGMVHLVDLLALRVAPYEIAVSASRIDFGRVPLNGSAAETLIVRNDGGGPIHARFVVEGTGYAVEPDELILQPGVEWSITIVASPQRIGRLDDVLRIQIVGSENAAVAIPLAAEAGPGEGRGEPGSELHRV